MPDLPPPGHVPVPEQPVAPLRPEPETVQPAAAPALPELRSDEVQEILAYIPHWMIRWGLSIILVMVIGLMTLSWLIRYPDIIAGDFVLSTETPPVKLAAPQAGKLTHIRLEQGSTVQEGDIIAEMESPITQEGIAFLVAYLDHSAKLLKNPGVRLPMPQELVFGPLQPAFNELAKQSIAYQQWALDPYEQQLGHNLREKIRQYEALLVIHNRQQELGVAELETASNKFAISRSLYEDSVLAQATFFQEESQYRSKALELEGMRKTGTMDRITLTDLKRQLLEWEQNRQEKSRRLQEDIRLARSVLSNGLENWQQGFLITAPYQGRLEMIQEVIPNQYVAAGTALFALIPPQSSYIGILKVPAAGYGKIKAGQKVRIRLDQFPAHQFGFLIGEIGEIALIPAEKKYRIEVRLPQGLLTHYGEELPFSPEMTGKAEVVTEDLRIWDRLFNQFQSLTKS